MSSGPASGVAASLSSSRSRSSASGASGFATRRASEKPVVSLAVGDRVTHDQFGLGTVVGVKGTGANAEATVDFGEHQAEAAAAAVRAGGEAVARHAVSSRL